MTGFPSWRMLPPAGAPLTAGILFSALTALAAGKPVEETLRADLAELSGARHVRLADTGRAALSLALLALSRMRPQRDEVLVPAYVSFSVPSAAVNAGLKVRLYDVRPDDLTPEYQTLRAAVSERTLAVVVCHQFGLPFDPAPAVSACRNSGAALIDDAAQAMGGMAGGTLAGRFGHAGLFSLGRGKPLTAVDGGILLTDDDAIAREFDAAQAETPGRPGNAAGIVKAAALLVLRRPAWYRLPASLPWLNIGASVFDPSFRRAPISRFRLGLASFALPLLEGANTARRRVAETYRREFAESPHIRPIPVQPDSTPVYLRFPIMPAPGAEGRLQALVRAQNGLPARKRGIVRGFPLPLDAVPALRPHLAEPGGTFPGARFLAENLVTLPTHDQIGEREIASVVRFLAGDGSFLSPARAARTAPRTARAGRVRQ